MVFITTKIAKSREEKLEKKVQPDPSSVYEPRIRGTSGAGSNPMAVHEG
jgi:hypothetical protein